MPDLTTDPNDPRLGRGVDPQQTGQQEAYLIAPQLPEEYRATSFIRPVRQTYIHTGDQPKHFTRPLTDEEHERYDQYGYVLYEPFSPDENDPVTGRFWTQKQLDAVGCKTATTMALPLAETYAKDPTFYGSTYCVHCQKHLPVAEFTWEDGTKVGS